MLNGAMSLGVRSLNQRRSTDALRVLRGEGSGGCLAFEGPRLGPASLCLGAERHDIVHALDGDLVHVPHRDEEL